VRHFAYDVVPQREGELVLPEVRLRYFDPANERFEVATTKPILIRVEARSPATGPPIANGKASDSKRDPEESDATTSGSTVAWRRWATWIAILVGAGAGARAWRIARRKRLRIATLVADLEGEFDRQPNPTAIAEILRSGISWHLPHAGSLSAEEIGSLPDLPVAVQDAVRLLSVVERARFDPGSRLPDRQEIFRIVERL
jgi:hypothetical protein